MNKSVFEFQTKRDKVIELILYLTRKENLRDVDAYSVAKFLYLSDRKHFQKYGRPITFEKYVAMNHGPVPSFAYDIMKGKDVYKDICAELPFDIIDYDGIRIAQNPKRDINWRIFSKSDLKTVDEIVEEFGNYSFSELREYTHDHYAYKHAWGDGKSKSSLMNYEDFLEETYSKPDVISDFAAVSKFM